MNLAKYNQYEYEVIPNDIENIESLKYCFINMLKNDSLLFDYPFIKPFVNNHKIYITTHYQFDKDFYDEFIEAYKKLYNSFIEEYKTMIPNVSFEFKELSKK